MAFEPRSRSTAPMPLGQMEPVAQGAVGKGAILRTEGLGQPPHPENAPGLGMGFGSWRHMPKIFKKHTSGGKFPFPASVWHQGNSCSSVWSSTDAVGRCQKWGPQKLGHDRLGVPTTSVDWQQKPEPFLTCPKDLGVKGDRLGDLH